ncbi:MAG: YeeE/YedE family protein [Proteobacteria bacterium]|nr:YeeE/YedE family protein [Pseudomonadota bacterium]
MTSPDAVVDQAPRQSTQIFVAAVGLIALAAGAFVLGADGWRMAALFLVGGLFGMSLYHAAFGFTAAYRNAYLHRDVSGVMAQLVMLAVAMVIFAALLSDGEIFGRKLGGALAPVGVQVALGSFVFGMGMQLGGACGSGTLYTVGGGSLRMLATLAAFCLGGFWASLDMPWWLATPRMPAVSLAAEFGWGMALALQLGLLALIWWGLRRWRSDAPQRPLWRRDFTWRQVLVGPWPLLLAAFMLAALNGLTVVIAGHPWSITWGFTLWGAKLAQSMGWDPATSPFWNGDFASQALSWSLWRDVTSVMNGGIILGALLAAGLAGRFAPGFRLPLKSLAAALIGGLMMGYGARIAFGCNIGAFFSGVASTSLHGWLWIACALPGTWIGLHLRPWFGLKN